MFHTEIQKEIFKIRTRKNCFEPVNANAFEMVAEDEKVS